MVIKTDTENKIYLKIVDNKARININNSSDLYAYCSRFYKDLLFSTFPYVLFKPSLTIMDLTKENHNILENINKIKFVQYPENYKYINPLMRGYYKENNNFNNFISNIHKTSQGYNIKELHYNAMSDDKINFDLFPNIKKLYIGHFYNHDIDNLPESIEELDIIISKKDYIYNNEYTPDWIKNFKEKKIYLNNLENMKKLNMDCYGIINKIFLTDCKKLENINLSIYNKKDFEAIDFNTLPQSLKKIDIKIYYKIENNDNLEIDLSYLKSLEEVIVLDEYTSKPEKNINIIKWKKSTSK